MMPESNGGEKPATVEEIKRWGQLAKDAESLHARFTVAQTEYVIALAALMMNEMDMVVAMAKLLYTRACLSVKPLVPSNQAERGARLKQVHGIELKSVDDAEVKVDPAVNGDAIAQEQVVEEIKID
jgi:hypothetical protein